MMRACNIRATMRRDLPDYGLKEGEPVTIIQVDRVGPNSRVLVQTSDRKQFPMTLSDVQECEPV